MIGVILSILAHVDKYYKVYYLLYNTIKLIKKQIKTIKMEGYWSKSAEKGASKFADDKIKFKGKFRLLEAFDGIIIGYAISYLDDNFAVKMPEQFVDAYKKIGKAFEKYDDNGKVLLSDFVTSDDVAAIVDGFIDVPKMTDEVEAIMFAATMKGVFDVVANILKKEEV